MCNFENILRFSHFSIALDMSRITYFLAEIMIPKKSASGNFLTFSMSVLCVFYKKNCFSLIICAFYEGGLKQDVC